MNPMAACNRVFATTSQTVWDKKKIFIKFIAGIYF
jgi:hypothetical protein